MDNIIILQKFLVRQERERERSQRPARGQPASGQPAPHRVLGQRDGHLAQGPEVRGNQEKDLDHHRHDF